MIISENTCTSYIRRTLAFGYEIGTKKCNLYTSNYGNYDRLQKTDHTVYIKNLPFGQIDSNDVNKLITDG